MVRSKRFSRFFVPQLGFLEDRTTPAVFAEPVTLFSTNGVLDVTFTAMQSTINLDTVVGPVDNALTYGFVLNQGNSTGPTQGEGLYPGPTLQVNPGDTLIFRFNNDLKDLTIPDFTDLDGNVLTSAPINNHTHGLHVSPLGNSDNVLLNIDPNLSNTYTYQIPTDQQQGLYWYHNHRHMLTQEQTYRGLSGMLEIGRPDGNIPLVTQNQLPIRNLAIQYNLVFDRKDGLSTLIAANGNQPWNMASSPVGTTFIGDVGTLPNNLMSFTGTLNGSPVNIVADPSLPDSKRDLQYTINGQFQPTLTSARGQTEIWNIANISDYGYARIRLTKTSDGSHPVLLVLGQDGVPYTTVTTGALDGGTTLLMPPGSRYTLAVTIPQTGELVLEVPPDPTAGLVQIPASNAYVNLGGSIGTATGTITIDPSAISYYHGDYFPTQTLMRVTPDAQTGTTVNFVPGQALNAYNDFTNLAAVTPDFYRTAILNEGNLDPANPNEFIFTINGDSFPYPPVFQPTLNSVEEWTYYNETHEDHPIHIHINDLQVMSVTDPNNPAYNLGVQLWGQDVINVPAGKFDAQGHLLEPGKLVMRMKFTEFTGTYVFHCHRLDHEDNGMMQIVTVLPQKATYAVGLAGVNGTSSVAQVRDSADESLLASITPFPGFMGQLSVAMADVNGDTILDLIVAAGQGGGPRVSVYSGADNFQTRLQNFYAFNQGFLGGVSIAAGDINGDGLADIIAGAGPGGGPQVSIFTGMDGMPFASFNAYNPGFRGGVNVAAGLIDESGRTSIVTGPGAGGGPQISTWVFDLYQPVMASAPDMMPIHMPMKTSNFLAFDASYTGGVSVATGWTSGQQGGFQNILVGALKGSSHVVAFSSGSSLQGFPSESMNMSLAFTQATSFYAFAPNAPGGVRLAASSTRVGASVYASSGSPTVAQVAKFQLVRPTPKATYLVADQIDDFSVAQSNGQAPSLGGA